jgi:hypothetical protein
VANGTNTYCGRYYKVVPGDYCNLVILEFSISLETFAFLNPAINEKYFLQHRKALAGGD